MYGWDIFLNSKFAFQRTIMIFIFLGSVVACSGYGGVEVNTGPVSVTVSVNGDGEIEIDSNVVIAFMGNEYLGVNLLAGYSLVLNEAKETEYKLYIVQKAVNGDVWVNEYNIMQKFKVDFSDRQIVKKIESVGNGSIVVSVEVSASIPKVDPLPNNPSPSSNNSCQGTTISKILIDRTAYVCTQKDRLIIREVPGGSEILRLYPNEDVFVIDGPECNDFSTWWKIEIPSGTKATVGQTDYDDYFYTNKDVFGWVREGGDYIDPYYLCQ